MSELHSAQCVCAVLGNTARLYMVGIAEKQKVRVLASLFVRLRRIEPLASRFRGLDVTNLCDELVLLVNQVC
jgi:hypothetical protein